ncbi:MAG: hypothetical protein Q9216_001911 [Gyalolechia sp. 2 TL-2023]
MTSQGIIKSLDALSVSVDNDVTRRAENLQNIVGDSELLVHVCLEWSASIHRQGHARIYAASRLLRKWSKNGMDVETFIHNFLARKSNCCGLEKSSLYKVINELIRSRNFSVGKYLQWIIANGMLRQHDTTKKELPCAMGLIFEISPDGLPVHVLNLRQNLLRSIGISTKDEKRTSVGKKPTVERQLHATSLEHVKFREFADISANLSQESSILKSGIGRWIWRALTIRRGAQHAFDQHSSVESQLTPHLSSYLCHDVAQFRAVLGVLEDVEDFSTLGDVLTLYSTSHDPRLLADVTVATSHYQDIFEAIGLAFPLFMRLFRRHALLHGQPLVIPFTKALIDLGSSMPNCFNETRTLQKLLQKSEAASSIAACSPISEHMTEALQTSDSATMSTYADELDQLLSSGSSMERRLLDDVFESLWHRFEATWSELSHLGFAVALLISRLASFDVSAVYELTIHWVEKTLALPSRPKLTQLGIPLISARLISLEQFLSKALQLLQKERRSIEYRDLLLELLGFLTADRGKAEWSISSLRYRFYAEQQRFLRGFPPVMVSILQHVLQYAHTASRDSIAHIAKLLQDSRFLCLLRTLPDSDAPNFETINRVFGSIVTMEGAAQTLSRIMSLVEDSTLTLPYRRLYLRAILSETSQSNEDLANHVTSILMDKVSTSSTVETQQWVNLMTALPSDKMRMIRDKAEADFFVLLSQKCETQPTSFQRRLGCLLSLIEKTGKGSHSASSATQTYDLLVVVSDEVSAASLSHWRGTLLDRYDSIDSRLYYIHPPQSTAEAPWLQTVIDTASGEKAAQRPFPVRKWETMPDATPLMTENDTSVSLTLFGARKAVL